MAVSLRFRVPVFRTAAVGVALVVGCVGTPASWARAEAPPPPPDVDVVSYVVADYDTGQILAEQAPHKQLYPASTLKVLTADTLIPRLSPSMSVTPKASDFAAEPDGSVVGMMAGVTYTVADLWRATFIDSANDAVAELAHLAGGVDTTVALMQKQARALGAYDTVVADADGYDVDGQVTSAYDLALLARVGLHNADFRTYCALRQATFPGPDGKSIALKSHDPMLMGYPGMIGVKGGITTKAGHTYVGAATRDGHTVIETLMLGGTDIFDQAAKLMDWGLAADGHVKAVGTLGGGASGGASSGASTAASSTASSAASTAASTPSSSASVVPPTPSGTTAALAAVQSTSVAPSPTAASMSSSEKENVPLRASKSADLGVAGRSSGPASPDALWVGLIAAGGALAVPVGCVVFGRRRA